MKQMKRKYSSFFVRRIIPCVLVAGAFGAFGTWSLHFVSRDWAGDEERTIMSVLESSIEKGKGEDDFDAQWIFSQIPQNPMTSISAVICNTETGEYWDSRPRVGVILHYHGEKGEYGKAKIERYLLNDEELTSRFFELTDTNVTKQIQPECLDIYIKGNEFLPGKVIQTKWGMEPEPKQIGETIDLTPADTTGWTHIVANQVNSLTISEGNTVINTVTFGTEPKDARILENANEYAKNHLAEWGVNNSGNNGASAYVSNPKKDDNFRWDHIEANGQKYHIYVYTHLNFYSSWAIVLWAGWGFLVAVALGIAAIWALAVYRRYCKDYEMTEYRRKLTGALAHDLKTPLTAISGYAENLLDSVHTEKREHYVTAILENTRYMDRMIADVLELSKLEQTETLSCAECDLLQAAREAFAPYTDILAEKHITVQFSGGCRAKANLQMMQQAFSNLAANAVKYTCEGGCIDVSGTDKALCMVNDMSGTLENAAELTAAFAKGDKARGSNSGSGLGLTIVQNIASLHHFSFSVSAGHGKFKAEIQVSK